MVVCNDTEALKPIMEHLEKLTLKNMELTLAYIELGTEH